MSEQPPLASPSGPEPTFPLYDAPAYGDVAPETAPLAEPTLMAPAPPTGFPPPAEAAWAPPYPVSPPGQNPYQVAPQYVAHVGAPTHPLATTSLVLGILGIAGIVLAPFLLITFFSAICSPFALWLGVRSRREIRANPRQYSGEGVATAGFVTGIIGLVLGIVGLLLIVAFVVFLAALLSAA